MTYDQILFNSETANQQFVVKGKKILINVTCYLAKKYLRKLLANLNFFFSVCLPNSFTPIEQDILVQKEHF